ncbi:hypothetical protein Tco_1516044 [Tanacetum coccineum]
MAPGALWKLARVCFCIIWKYLVGFSYLCSVIDRGTPVMCFWFPCKDIEVSLQECAHSRSLLVSEAPHPIVTLVRVFGLRDGATVCSGDISAGRRGNFSIPWAVDGTARAVFRSNVVQMSADAPPSMYIRVDVGPADII